MLLRYWSFIFSIKDVESSIIDNKKEVRKEIDVTFSNSELLSITILNGVDDPLDKKSIQKRKSFAYKNSHINKSI